MTDIAQPIPLGPLVDARRHPVTVTTVPAERAQLAVRPRAVPAIVEHAPAGLARMPHPIRVRVAVGTAVAGGLFLAAMAAGFSGVGSHLLGTLVATLGVVTLVALVALAVVSHRRHCPGCAG
jgi:hypothetical protein